MVGPATSEFACPECDQWIAVNAAMREAILENGCPVCMATVAGEHFDG